MIFFEFVPLEDGQCLRCAPCLPSPPNLRTPTPLFPLTSSGSLRHHAAEKKRQELLDRRRERMAARVQHAKLVAERHRHEGLNHSLERSGRLELQLKTAESKRTELLQRAKNQCAAIVTHAKEVCQRHRSLREEATAAGTIQQWWRQVKHVTPAVKAVASLHLSVAKLELIGFEAASELIQAEAVTVPLGRLFDTFRRTSTVAASCIRGKRPERAFLAAHLMAAFPDITASPDGSFSQRGAILRDSAVTMIKSFEAFVASVPQPRKARQLLERFLADFYLYCDRFEEWRTPDSKKLLARLVLHFEDLEVFREQIRGNSREWDLYVPQIISEKQRLVAQMRKIGAEKVAKKMEARCNDPTSPTTPTTPTAAASDAFSSSAAAPTPAAAAAVPVPAPSAPLFDDNQRLVHQLATNPDFEFKSVATPAFADAEGRDPPHEAFWRHVEHEIRVREFALVRVYFLEAREGLLSMVPDSKTFLQAVDDVLSLSHLQHDDIKPELLLPVVLDFMGRTCAPARDEAVRGLKRKCQAARNDPAMMAALMRDTLSTLKQMQVDLANYHLKVIMPYLKNVAVEYEREKFKAKLESGEVKLEKTREWLQLVKRNQTAGEALSSADPEGLFFRGICHLVLSPGGLNPSDLPEVLSLDEEVLLSSHHDFKRLIMVATLMTLSRNMIPELRDPAFGAPQIQQRMDLLLRDPDIKADDVCVHLFSEFSKQLKAMGKPPISSQHQNLLKGLVGRAFEGQDTVFKLLTRRLREYLEGHLFRGRKASDDFFRKAGLELVKEDLISVAEKLTKTVSHTFATFGSVCTLNDP